MEKQKTVRLLKRGRVIWIAGAIVVALVLLGVLFYRVYVYDPVAAQLGGRVTHFSIDFRNGPSVAKAIEWPEDVTAEQLEAAYEAYYASR